MAVFNSNDVLDLMEGYLPNQREMVFELLREKYCEHCGFEHPKGGVCHCNNDD